MIIVAISGGPGNQLFQYAAGKYLSDRLKCKLVLDYSWYKSRAAKDGTKREFILDYLIDAKGYDFAISGILAKIIRVGMAMISIASPIFRNLKYTRIDEVKKFKFDTKFNEIYGNIFINGFWQAEQYTRNLSLKTFSKKFIEECEQAMGSKLSSEIKEPNTISVSVRRASDYSEDLLVCTPSYYSNSAKKICKLLNNDYTKKIYIFSDNIEWCRKELKFDFDASITYIEKFDAVDNWKTNLYINALCENHVISNSTFEWWAATLGQRKNKELTGFVIAPKYWWTFIPVEDIDIYPTNWIVDRE